LTFDEQSINDHSLVEFISEYHSISKVKALKVLEAFETKIKTGLDSRSKVRVNGLGLFEKAKDGSVKFTPIKSIPQSIFHGFKNVPISIAKTPEKQADQEIDKIEEQIVTTETVKNIESDKSEIVQQSTLKQEEKSTVMPDYNDPNYENNHGYNSDYDGPSKWSYLLRPLLILLGFILLSAFLFKKCANWTLKNDSPKVVDEFQDNSNDNGDETKNLDSDVDSNEENTADNNETASNEEGVKFSEGAKPLFTAEDGADIYKHGDISNQPLNCIIITGTFKSSSNILRMIKKLEAEGYDSYTEQVKNGMTRVGFFFQCKESDLESYIYDIRQRISTDAWYLSPRIHVD